MVQGIGNNYADQNYIGIDNNSSELKNNFSSNNKLERIPAADTTSFSGKKSENLLNNCDVEVSNGFLGMGKRRIKGSINGVPIDVKLDTSFWNSNVKLTGMLNGKPVDLKLKDYKLTGEISEEDKKLLPYLQKFMRDKRNYDEMMTVVVASV